MQWILGSIPYLKALHIVALFVWCGGLLALVLMLLHHDPAGSASSYRRIRRATHVTYTVVITPAAVAAVISGTWLIFLRGTFVPWFYAKLCLVALLVGGHAWIGHIVVKMGETVGRHPMPPAYLPLSVLLVPMLAIIVLVLGKPDFVGLDFPEWLTTPQSGRLPFTVPR